MTENPSSQLAIETADLSKVYSGRLAVNDLN